MLRKIEGAKDLKLDEMKELKIDEVPILLINYQRKPVCSQQQMHSPGM